MSNNNDLIVLYQQMADLTSPECASVCRAPHSCCSPEYCVIAMEYAREEWGVDLSGSITNHARLPFMGSNGCVVAPHLRPLCTLHTCEVNGLGFKKNDPDGSWNERYSRIREAIDDLECRRERPVDNGVRHA